MRKSMRGFGVSILMGFIPFLVLLFLSINANAQWVSIVPPEVSSSWGLNKGRILASGTDGWAVGTDVANKRGVIIQAKSHLWTPIMPPNVSSDWELNAVGFTSADNAWAVGIDYSTGSRQGVILHFQNGLWTIVTPPYVSLDWGLYDAFFTGSNDGWVVGFDYANKRGVLLNSKSGVWSSTVPPDVSDDWGLSGICMINTKEGWAVGVDHTNKRGVLLHFTKDLEDIKKTKRIIWQVYLPPQLNGDWELNGISFLSVKEGWAVGVNHTEKRGLILHFVTPRWDEVIPPQVSSDFEFNSTTFHSTSKGWISGVDSANKKGILLQYDNKVWIESPLPEISPDWMLGNVRFAASDQFWAFGTDVINKTGVILRYSVNTKETISTPSTPNGPTSIAPSVVSTYYTGESLSNLDHSVQYFFDWGDGTDSGWLPVGTVGASKSWTSPGTYLVKAQARCDTDISILSKLSSELSVTVSDTPTTVTLVSSPADGTFYTACSLYALPTFTWKSDGSFTDYEVQFSKKASFDTIDASKKTSSTSVLMDDTQWQNVIDANGTEAPGSSAPATSGGPMFWRVIGTRSDKVSVISNTLSILIAPAQPVGNATIVDTSKSSLPTLSWDNNCGIKFTVHFGNNPFFTHKTSVTFNIKDPNDNGGVFTKTLTSSQWKAVQNITGHVTGATVYWYVDSRDGAGRRAITQPNMFFVISD